MKRLIPIFISAVILSTLLISGSPVFAEEAKGGMKIGGLKLMAIEGTRKNLIIRSSVEVEGEFTDSKGNKEYYIGEMGVKLGVDLSIKKKETLVYQVLSLTKDYRIGSYALQGKYFGQDASVALKIGLGAKILLGGFEDSIALQPLAVKGIEGVGATLGIGYLYLQKDPNK